MEDTSRPLLLSPGLPRLPGGLEPLPPAEPPLTHEEFAPRPPPLPCAPIPPDIAAKIAAGKVMEVALEGWRKKSQLAWVMDQMRREEEEAAAAEAAAEAAAAAQQAERPARAPRGPAAHAAASAAVSSNSGSEDEAGSQPGALSRQPSRASVVHQDAPSDDEMDEAADAGEAAGAQQTQQGQQGQQGQQEQQPAGDTEEASAAEEAEQHEQDDQLAAMLEQELAGEGGSAAEEDAAAAEAAAAEAAAAARAAAHAKAVEAAINAPVAVAAAVAAAQARAAEAAGAAKPTSAAGRRQRRQVVRPPAAAADAAAAPASAAATAAASVHPAAVAAQAVSRPALTAAAQPAAVAAQPAAAPRPPPAARPPALPTAAGAAAAAAEAAGAFDVGGGWEDLGPSSEDESGSEEEGQPGQAGQQRQPTLAERAVAAALEKIGEPSWEAFCAKLQEQQAAAGAAGGGGRGRGRGRKGGRGKRKAGAEGVQLATVLNKNSPIFHEGFAAAFKEARAELDKLDVRKQRREKLKEFSKLVARWSELTVQEHEWYLAHQGQALTGSDAQRFALLASKVAEEQQQYYQDVQQKAAGGAAAARYGHCTARQGAQMEQDVADRRQRQVQQLPRLYRLVAPLPVAAAPETPAQAAALLAEAPQLQHLGTLHREGEPPAFGLPAGPALLNSSLRYLPCTVEGSEAGTAGAAGATGGSSTAGGAGRGGGVPRVFSKRAVPLLAGDPALPQLVQQAAGAAAPLEAAGEEAPPPPPPPAAAGGQPLFCLAASAFAALVSTPMLRCGPGWEIPVTILSAEEAAGGGSGGGASGDGGSSSDNVVCLEKPLLQRLMAMRAKQQRLQKYAVLSLGVQPPAGAAQQAQQAQQQQSPPRRRTRGSAAASAGPEGGAGEAPAVEAAAPGGNSAAAGPALPQREAAFNCWQLGDCRMLVRSHGRLRLQQQEGEGPQQQQQQQPVGQQQQAEQVAEQQQGQQQGEQQQQDEQQQPGEAAGQHVVLGLKTEYLPDPDTEEYTMEELCAWWLKLLLRPDAAALLAAHVHVPHSRLLTSERLTAGDIEGLCGGAPRMRALAAAGLAMLQGLLRELGRQPPGRYLLTHVPYEQQCCLFRAVPAEVAQYAQAGLAPLPCSPSSASPGVIYDLHAAHEHSGATDAGAIQFVPPRWRRFMPDIPQIPHTFPPRMSMSKMGAKRAARKRQRKQMPFAWGVLGEGGDFDQVQHVAQISRADYLAGLQDELA